MHRCRLPEGISVQWKSQKFCSLKIETVSNHLYGTRGAMFLIEHIMFHPILNVVVPVSGDEQMPTLIGILVKLMCKSLCILGLPLTQIIILLFLSVLNYNNFFTSHQTLFLLICIVEHKQMSSSNKSLLQGNFENFKF